MNAFLRFVLECFGVPRERQEPAHRWLTVYRPDSTVAFREPVWHDRETS